jgi:branched-chain amino acid transport system permease protein
VVVLFFPRGIWGTLAERFGLHLFPIRRRLRFAGDSGDLPSFHETAEEPSHD